MPHDDDGETIMIDRLTRLDAGSGAIKMAWSHSYLSLSRIGCLYERETTILAAVGKELPRLICSGMTIFGTDRVHSKREVVDLNYIHLLSTGTSKTAACSFLKK
jgi:hypothetical protein